MGLFQPVPAVGPASTFGKSEHLALMRRLYELYTAYSFLGSRRMTGMLRAEGLRINRKRVQRLMRHMAPGPRPRTKPTPGRKR